MVGDDLGSQDLVDNLNQKKVKTNFVKVSPNNYSGVAIITLVHGDNSIVINGGANLLITKEQIDEALKISSTGDFFVSQCEIDLEMTKYGIIQAKNKGLLTILNPSPINESIPHMYPYIDYLILNETECFSLTNMNPSSDQDVITITNYFKAKGVKNIVITKGSQGVSYLHDSKVINIPARNVQVLDTTAAGDTFLGVFVSRLMKQNKILEALEIANLAASLAVEKIGAQNSIPYLSEIEKKYFTLDR
jgi:ribokinase